MNAALDNDDRSTLIAYQLREREVIIGRIFEARADNDDNTAASFAHDLAGLDEEMHASTSWTMDEVRVAIADYYDLEIRG